MDQRNLVIGLLVFVLSAFGLIVFYDVNYGHKFERKFGKSRQTQNWKWEDDWDSKDSPVVPTKPNHSPTPVTPIPLGQQFIAGSYQEAILKSGETGKPVLVFFTADWCNWCKKMKLETMMDSKVQSLLKNYILVYVDTDKDRSPVAKFNIESLPSYIITNSKEEKLKYENGYKNSGFFANWLNDPNLYNQPKSNQDLKPQQQIQPQIQPQVRPQPQMQPNRRIISPNA